MVLIKNKSRLLLLAILFMGLFLRVYDLGSESLWLDEGCSINCANLSLYQIFFLQDTNPPLYYIVLHWWVSLFGDSEFSVRFPSVIFGFIAILMIYKIGNQIFDRNVGMLSSLLLGLSVFHIQYSQEARTYSLSVLLTLLSMYFFIRLLNRRSYVFLMGYILFSILLMYSHVYGLFIIISQNIYVFVLFLLSKEAYKLNTKRWISIQIILIILFVPHIIILVKQIFNANILLSWIPKPYIKTIIASFSTYSGSELLLLLFLILSSFSIVSIERISGNFDWRNIFKSFESYCWKIRLLNTNKVFLLLLWLITPIILPFIISRVSTPIYHTRYTIVASLPFYLLVSKGISNISHKYFRSIIIILIITFSFVYIWGYYTEVNKEQWRDVANYIDSNAQKDDLILFNPSYCIYDGFNYYSKRVDLTKKQFPEKTDYVDRENIGELEPLVRGYNRVWVILSHSKDKKGLIKTTLIKTYNLSYNKKYKGIRVYMFKKYSGLQK